MFCLQRDLFVAVYNLVVSRCFTSALKRRLEAKRLALALFIIGNTLATSFGH